MNLLPPIRRIFSSRRRRVVAVAALLLLITACFGRQWVAREFESRLTRSLAERGLVLDHDGMDWNPWRGLRLVQVEIRQAGGNLPLLESGNLMVHVPLAILLRGSATTTRWQIRDAGVTLHDEQGGIRLEKVSLALETKHGELRVRSATASKAGLTVSVHGTIRIADPGTAKGPVSFDGSTVRDTLAALEVEGAGDPFLISGDFSVDATSAVTRWNARLAGKGHGVVWQGIPLRSVRAGATLSSGGSDLEAAVILPHGSANFTARRDGGPDTPIRFRGTLADGSGRTNTFSGSGRRQLLEIDRFEGDANLWEIAKRLPAVEPHLPRQWAVPVFPALKVERIRRRGPQGEAGWSVGSIRIQKAGQITARLQDRDVTVSGVSGEAGFDGTRWSLSQLRGKVFGGTMQVSGHLEGTRLTRSRILAEGIRWKRLRQWAGHDGDRASRGILHVDYRGDLDLRNGHARGNGRVRLENAPVLEVPLLDETYDLFAALIPGVKAGGEGRFDATVIARPGILEVTRFDATGGSVTVSAKGTVDLQKQRVDGRARGKLSGLPGLVTGPLGRLLEMDVAGPYDDIRVQPLGPAKLVSNAASTALDSPVETLEEAGKIAGTVVVESIKLPFRLFSKEPRRKEDEPAQDR